MAKVPEGIGLSDMEEKESATRIDNIVITCMIGLPDTTSVDLILFADLWWMLGVQMNSLRFPNLVVPIREPKCTVLVFGSGKIVVEGCKYVTEGIYVLREVCNMINRENGTNARCSEMIIQNVVANHRFNFGVNLQKLATDLGEYCVVTPTFPGARIREKPELQGTTAIVFWTGSLVVTGGVNTKQVRAVTEATREMLYPYRLKQGERKEDVLARCSMPYQTKKLGNRARNRKVPYKRRKISTGSQDSIPSLSELDREPTRIIFE